MFCVCFAVFIGVVGVKWRQAAAEGTKHSRMTLQAPREMTCTRTSRAQGLIFHEVPIGQSQSQGSIQDAPCTSMVQCMVPQVAKRPSV